MSDYGIAWYIMFVMLYYVTGIPAARPPGGARAYDR